MTTRTTARLTTAVEHYLTDLHRIRASGSATGERSSYGPLANLLNAVHSIAELSLIGETGVGREKGGSAFRTRRPKGLGR